MYESLVGFKPMLSAKFDPEVDTVEQLAKLTFPMLVSPKLDGIRVCCHPILGPSTRSLKPVPNVFIRGLLSDSRLWCLDGEVIVGDHESPAYSFQATESAVMSHGGEPQFTYAVFDNFSDPQSAFIDRFGRAGDMDKIQLANNCWAKPVVSTWCNTIDDALLWEKTFLELHYEGLMLRHPQMPYKFGRSTLKQQGLIKLKRFVDAEAVIEGFIELERNNNAPTQNELGLQTRSSHKSNMVPANTLGALSVRGIGGEWGGVTFEVGSGFDVATRDLYWATRHALVGQLITYKYQAIGSLNKPRVPIFKGLRRDLK